MKYVAESETRKKPAGYENDSDVSITFSSHVIEEDYCRHGSPRSTIMLKVPCVDQALRRDEGIIRECATKFEGMGVEQHDKNIDNQEKEIG